VQRAEGYEATLVARIPIFERGEPTGAKQGGRLTLAKSVAFALFAQLPMYYS